MLITTQPTPPGTTGDSIMTENQASSSAQEGDTVAPSSLGKCEFHTSASSKVTHRADGRACRHARQWVAEYCRRFLAGDCLSWEHGLYKSLADKEAKQHLVYAILTGDFVCDALLGMVQATSYLDPSQFATTYRNILVEIGVLD